MRAFILTSLIIVIVLVSSAAGLEYVCFHEPGEDSGGKSYDYDVYGDEVDDQIDAITGATSTSNAVLRILNQLLNDAVSKLEGANDD